MRTSEERMLFSKENTNQDNSKYKEGVNQNARLIVRNISFKATEEALRTHFEPYGDLEEVKLLKKPDGRLVGCGFIHYKHVPMANKAKAATNKKPFMGRPISVSWAVEKTKYVENMKQDPEKFKSEDDSFEVVEVKGELLGSTEEPVKKEKQERINRNARLIVRNISFKVTEETLRQHFEPYGNIHEVKLLKKPDGKLVGCAFVHYDTVPMAKKALLHTNMKPFLGRPISVDWAVAKDKYMQFMDRQKLDLQEDVKKEDSDSDNDGDDDDSKMNVSDEVKAEVKSENGDGKDRDDDDSDEEEDDEDDDEEIDDDNQSVVSTQPEKKRIMLNDAEDGCTVFITNISFSIDNDQLKQFAEKFGAVKYALVCVDKLTEHSRGTGFVKFVNQEDADKFLSLTPSELNLDGQALQVKPALKRDSLQKGDKKQPKDNRNLYLVKEGVIVASTKAAVGVSASDMAKRLALERSKTQMLKNLNRFVSRYRLVVSNLPPNYDDAMLRKICFKMAGSRAVITEARVMRHIREAVQRDGKHPSKGYGFVMFTRHEDAILCLRKLNNNPDIFDKNNRPIVSFSIEDRTALNARKKRLEKSIANNPMNKTENKDFNNRNTNFNNRNSDFNNRNSDFNNRNSNFNNKNSDFNNRNSGFNNRNSDFNNRNSDFTNRKRKFDSNPDESMVKKRKFERKNNYNKNVNDNETGKFVRPNVEHFEEYSGLSAKQGTQHNMRSGQKLRIQADLHKQNLKSEKKMSKKTLKLKMAAKERIKQPKMTVNKNPKMAKKGQKITKGQSNVNFSDLVNKYKTKLVSGNKMDRVKAKWFDN